MTTKLEKQLAALPNKPGVYLHKDAGGRVLYVGKAVNLRSRVRSYFSARTTISPARSGRSGRQPDPSERLGRAGKSVLAGMGTDGVGRQQGGDHPEKIRRMVAKVVAVDHIVTRDEVEALLLEANFIKQYQPPYNVRLRDDKHFLFVKITLADRWPRVTTSRSVAKDKARYFGPYTDSRPLRQTLKTLRRVFPYCTPNDACDDKTRQRPCLYYHLGLCPSPQHGKIRVATYRANIDGVMRVLSGQTKSIRKQLERDMKRFATAKQYEAAATYRNRLHNLEALVSDQQVIDTTLSNRDVIGLAQDANHAVVTLFSVRDGRVVAREQFSFWGTAYSSDQEIIDSFLGQYYKVAASIPPEVLLPINAPNAPLVATYLGERLGRKVRVRCPVRGAKRDQVGLARTNAEEHLRQLRRQWLEDQRRTEGATQELAAALKLPAAPERIECYDISTLRGTSTVGAMVVFQKGQPAPAHYRRFQIRHVRGIDDYAAMQEVLRRRFKRVVKRSSRDESFRVKPDLVIIDGGKGQVSAASAVFAELGLKNMPLLGLAKRLEEIVQQDSQTGKFRVLQLPKTSRSLYLLQRVRDETHRFAITYNRQMRRRRGARSILDELPGIGPAKKRQLLRTFGSVANIRVAGLPAIQAVVGQAAGRVVKDNL